MRTWIAAATLALTTASTGACDSKRKAPEAGAAAGATSPLAAKLAEPGPTPAEGLQSRPQPVYSPQQWHSYRQHIRRGRRLGQQDRWGEATRAFEAALDAIGTDGRALSELGWAALQAGDYERARAANLDAVQVASDPAVRAASLYNLGRLAEATGDREEAARRYRASLELRASDVVQRRLAGLGTAAPQAAASAGSPQQLCGPSASVDALCACLRGRQERGGAPLGCAREEWPVPDAELLFVGDEASEDVHLIAAGAGGRGWSAVATLGTVRRPDAREDAGDPRAVPGTHEELEVARFERRLVGERKVLWIETVQTRTQAGAPLRSTGKGPGQGQEPSQARDSRRTRTLTVCIWPPAGGLVCPLQVPLLETVERPAPRPAAAGERTVRRLAVGVSDDGVATVVLEEGPRTDAVASLLGQHALW